MSDNRSTFPVEKPRRIRVDMMTFVKAWQTSDNVDEVAEKLGLTKTSVQARASKYRSGVLSDDGKHFVVEPIALKRMNRRGGGGSRLDTAAANRLIAELGNANVENDVAKLKQAKIERSQ